MARAITERDMESFLSGIQLEQSVRMYNTVVEMAFRSCVHGFRTNELSKEERECVTKTTTKVLRHMLRVKTRVAEIQEEQQERLKKAQEEASLAVREVGLPSL